jgi:hypothetical protein
MSFEYLA